MIDWYTGLIGYEGSHLQLNRVFELTPSGEVKWSTDKAMTVQSTFDTSIQLRSGLATSAMIDASLKHNFECANTCLSFSGNPSKFLQGHNVFGPSVSALGPVLQAVVRKFPEAVRPPDADSPLWPAVHRSTVDITTSVDLGSHNLVHEYLRFLEFNTRSRHGRPIVSGDTVYFGKHSTRWALKLYCKFCELAAHPPSDAKKAELLRLWCEGQVRIELRLKGQELKDRGTLTEDLIWEYFSKIGVSTMKEDVNTDKLNLPRVVEFTFTEWLAGKDVRHSLQKTTFYRHRLLILEETGLDISLPCTAQGKEIKKMNVDLEYLKVNEIKKIPSVFQEWLFQPDKSPNWGAK